MSINTTYFSFRTRLQPVVSFETKCTRMVHTPTEHLIVKTQGTVRPLAYLATLLILFISFMSPATAQTYTTVTGTSNNIFPFGSSTNNKVQWLYTPSDFTSTVPTGQITKVYFRTFTGTYSATYTNFTIRMTTTTSSSFTSGTFLTGMTTVYGPGSQSISTSGNTWVGITLATPFFYTAGSNLVVEVEHSAMTGSVTMSHISTSSGNNRRIYGGFGSSSGTVNTSMCDLGLDIITGPPCPGPSGVSISNKTSKSATLSWIGATPSVGYSYVISTSSTTPTSGLSSTMGTTVNATGLTPNTTYYLHVRNNCSATNWSPWVTYQFQTNPPCGKRNLIISNVTTKSANIRWGKESHGTQYEYALQQDTTTPTMGTKLTTDSTFKADTLAEGTKYYVFVRMHCPGGEVSEWALDSFVTRTICRPPNLSVSHINSNRAVVYWNPMPTAIEYEYEVSQSPTPLGKGTTIIGNSFQAFPLKDGNVYYFHVKSKCNDQGFLSESEWTTTSFKTWPTSVANVSGTAILITAYPNPVKEELSINISGKIDGDARISILDLNGRAVRTATVNSSTITINMSNLPAGLYMLRYADAHSSELMKITKE